MASLSSTGKDSLDQLANKLFKEKRLPNFAFGATSVEKDIYFNAGGFNTVEDPQSGQVGPDSIFWLCSQTKLITHVAALQLIEQGKIAIDSPVADYIPELANPVIVDDPNPNAQTPNKPAKVKITIKHLLNFSSGLFYPFDPKGDHTQNLEAYRHAYSKDNALSEFFAIIKRGLPGVPLLFEPGTSFAYGWSSDILGFVIEKVTGLTLEQYLNDNIFSPLGVQASFSLSQDFKDRLVNFSYRVNGVLEARPFQKNAEKDPSKVNIHFGGAGLHASLKDYLVILRHLLQIHAGKAENPILGLEAVRSLFEGGLTDEGSTALSGFLSSVDPFIHRDKFQWSTAFPICTSDWPDRRKKGTGGWAGWANTYFFIDPTTGVAAVFGTQLVPVFDHEVLNAYAEFERALYAGLTY